MNWARFSLAQKLPWTIHLEFDWDKDSENLTYEYTNQCFWNKVREPDPFEELFPKCEWISSSTPIDFDEVGLGWTPGISIFKKRKEKRKGKNCKKLPRAILLCLPVLLPVESTKLSINYNFWILLAASLSSKFKLKRMPSMSFVFLFFFYIHWRLLLDLFIWTVF